MRLASLFSRGGTGSSTVEMFAISGSVLIWLQRSSTKLSGMLKGKESVPAKPFHVPAWKARGGNSAGVKLPAKA